MYLILSILLINISYISMKNLKLIISRHGESIWNKKNKFTGWTNINLSGNGVAQTLNKSNILQKNNLLPKQIYSSKLIRSINTAEIIKNKLEINNYIHTAWELNERHYGMLEGMDRNLAKEKYGNDKINLIRKNFYSLPYIINNEVIIDNKILINNNNETVIGESNNMVYKRVYPYWNNIIKQSLIENEIILIISHKNTIRCLMKIFENLNDMEFKNTDIKNNEIILYQFNDNLKLLSKTYLY